LREAEIDWGDGLLRTTEEAAEKLCWHARPSMVGTYGKGGDSPLAILLIGVGVTQGIFWGNRINVLDQWRQARALPQSRRSGPDTGR